MNKIFSVAIDGPAGAGKSVISKAVAEKKKVTYLDTGAMYRAIGLHMLNRGIALTDVKAMTEEIPNIDMQIRFENQVEHISINGEDLTPRLRTPEASEASSMVSAIPEIRVGCVEMQRRIAEGQSVLMDGRDIGTVVLPNATLKIYLTADVEARALRRFKEMQEKGDTTQTYEEVLEAMKARDYADMHRAASPLRCAEDARVLDSTNLSLEDTIKTIESWIDEAVGALS